MILRNDWRGYQYGWLPWNHVPCSISYILHTEYSKNLLGMYKFLSYQWHFQAVSILDLDVMSRCSQTSHTTCTDLQKVPLTSCYCKSYSEFVSLQWRHNDRAIVSNHRRPDCLLDCLFGRRSKKTSKLCVTGLCEGNSPVIGEFPAQGSGKAEMFPPLGIWLKQT